MTDRLKIALDYDGTITEDYEAWAWFIEVFRGRGHDIRIVTFRSPDELTSDLINFQLMTEDIKRWKIPIIFTSHTAKHAHCKEIGWDPNIWIDDCPALIDHDIKPWNQEQLAKWREENNINV